VNFNDVDRIIEAVTDAVVTEVDRRAKDRRSCACHEVLVDCCPNRLRGVLGAGAARLGLHAAGGAPDQVAGVIDHTLLRPDATGRDIDKVCDEAAQYGFVTVCLNATWVAHARRRLADAPVGVCSVVGFPFGATTPDVKQYEARRALADGASEIDMVINVGALKSGDRPLVQCDIEAVVQACRRDHALSKVIIETALLTDDEKRIACSLAKVAGADFVKTSTGFGPGGATVADVALMREVVGSQIGVKAAGGIRDYNAFKAMAEAGASRIGASAGIRIVHQARTGQ
jgi:deoxyribose-phosphate aldolase